MQTVELKADSKNEAKREYRKYFEAANATGSEEDMRIAKAYAAIARGQRVIDAIQSVKNAGCDYLLRPKLAICRAHAKWCWFIPRDLAPHSSTAGCFGIRIPNYKERRTFHSFVELPFGTFNNAPRNRLKALVPMVPPEYRPKHGLHNYHILWEADWEQPPGDPLLLKHLDGPLYVVLAAWNLTPVERAVLRLRSDIYPEQS